MMPQVSHTRASYTHVDVWMHALSTCVHNVYACVYMCVYTSVYTYASMTLHTPTFRVTPFNNTTHFVHMYVSTKRLQPKRVHTLRLHVVVCVEHD